MLIHKNKIVSTPKDFTINLTEKSNVSCEMIDDSIYECNKVGNVPGYILLTYPQYNELQKEICEQQRNLTMSRVSNLYMATYRGIIVLPYEPRCPLCSGEIWHKDSYVFACNKHIKQILAMNKLVG